MVKSETRRDAEILVRNPSPRLLGKKFRDSKKVKTNHAKTRFRDLSKTPPRFPDPAKIFRDPRFSGYHSPPLLFSLDDFDCSVIRTWGTDKSKAVIGGVTIPQTWREHLPDNKS